MVQRSAARTHLSGPAGGAVGRGSSTCIREEAAGPCEGAPRRQARQRLSLRRVRKLGTSQMHTPPHARLSAAAHSQSMPDSRPSFLPLVQVGKKDVRSAARRGGGSWRASELAHAGSWPVDGDRESPTPAGHLASASASVATAIALTLALAGGRRGCGHEHDGRGEGQHEGRPPEVGLQYRPRERGF